MLKHILHVPLAASLLLCVSAGPSIAADSEPSAALESLPPHLAYRVAQRQANLVSASLSTGLQAVVSRLKVWQPELFPITVCFFGGPTELRIRIRDAALEWSQHDARIPLDFGQPTPRTCSPNAPSDIKIGFAYNGYWSVVGQDSRDLVNANEQSMNFQYWDVVNPPAEPEFSRLVLHEFGHALGFQHEHQHPYSACRDEFDWDRVYTELGGPPNFWSREKVDFNMREILAQDVDTTDFDRRSIMLYTFPARFYRNGPNSNCYAKTNYRLSDSDKELAARLYPRNEGEAITARYEAVNRFTNYLNAQGVTGLDKLRAIQELELLTSPTLSGQDREAVIDRLQSPQMQLRQ